MKKRLIILLAFCIIWVLAGCEKKTTPDERLEAYVALWNDHEYTQMYDRFLTKETKQSFDTTNFVDRQEKLAKDLSIENLKVTFEKPDKETEWDPKNPAAFNIQVEMDTVAGPVSFEKKIVFIHETQDEEENWYAKWDPSFIFPELESKDTVGITTIDSKRGEILDRNDQPIAINGKGFEVGIVPGKFDHAHKKEFAKSIGVSPEFIDTQLNQTWVKPDYFVPIAKLARTDANVLDSLVAIPGVTYQKTPMREYPYGEALAHVSGYIGKITAEQLEERKDQGYKESDLIGRQGLERLLEDRLRGQDGIRLFIKKPDAGADLVVIAEKPATDGETVHVTIDAELQKLIYDSMKGEPGTSAAVNPNTGETLALVSSPSFDPAHFMLGMSGDRYKQLSEDPLQPLFNRFAAAYAPGSTMKPITAAIGLEAGTLNPSEGIVIQGRTWQKDASWGNYKVSRLHPEAPNPMDLNKALIYSDNIYFAQQALKLGRQPFIDGLHEFGYGEPLPFALNLAASQISNDGKISSEGQLADSSFGQGQMLTNILHLTSMYEVFLTDGVIYKPTLFAEEETGQVWKQGIMSPEHASIMRTDLRNVVVDGFAQAANMPNIPLAGKTGTAELKATGEGRGQENGFFVTYNSADPTLLLAMMIEHVEDNNGSGYVAAMVADVFKAYHAR
ncbi:penicillin-binding transpeptidase domain-containing protein [Sporosarcina sp. Te-1]|uniref:penicillin-binding transpeptidase domain-containing protein n=1 Tax=Sporosarcina sp. Te-1 TaxID=2818390 RepID=UPI001A9F9DD4|nr:penicillin-binding transpeptidase domain-containing protein [Sporosarcina sp. Te-1]QTD43080.1 penicillin-binding transpeptidase domain-containing protein [Sporosarcina sp. Te-1]